MEPLQPKEGENQASFALRLMTYIHIATKQEKHETVDLYSEQYDSLIDQAEPYEFGARFPDGSKLLISMAEEWDDESDEMVNVISYRAIDVGEEDGN